MMNGNHMNIKLPSHALPEFAEELDIFADVDYIEGSLGEEDQFSDVFGHYTVPIMGNIPTRVDSITIEADGLLSSDQLKEIQTSVNDFFLNGEGIHLVQK